MSALARISSLDLRPVVAQPQHVEVKAAITETPASWTAGYGLFLTPTDITPRMAWMLYESVGTLGKVIDLIADSVASLDPVVFVDGQPAPNPEPVLRFLAKPGFNRDRVRLIRELVVQHLLTGTTYLCSLGNIKYEPVALDVFKSMFVSPVAITGHVPESYIYSEGSMTGRFERQGARDYRWIDAMGMSELTPILAMDGQRRGIGRSRLSAIRTDVELRLKGTEHNTSMMDKGARPSGVLNAKGGMTAEQAQDLLGQARTTLGGSRNAGGILVAGGMDLQFTQLSMAPKDMDWSNLVKVTDDTIVARFNVPPTLFNSDAQTDNNYETAWTQFFDNAVLPEFRTIYAGIAQMLSFRTGLDIEIRHDPTKNNTLFRQISARVTGLKSANLITTNEARQEIGKEPLVGGDYIYGTGMEQPLEQDVYDSMRDMPAVAPPLPPGAADGSEGKPERAPKAERTEGKNVWLT